jgi:hypothetical protein
MSITDTVWRILFSSKTQAIRVNTLSKNLTENLTALKKLLPSEDILSYEFETEDKIPCCILYADGVVNKQLLGDLIARPLSRLSLQKEGGISALNAPGNDLIAATALAASGCQLVLFTTGRGTPFSTFVPTMKIASNDKISAYKSKWIDFNAYSMDENGLFELIVKTIGGEYTCKSEDVREIAFYKTGVTL